MADVFISYKHEDQRHAEVIAAQLHAAGYSTWWDTSLVAGETWNEAIRAELRQARCVVVLWSSLSWASRWVQAEAHAGFERDVLVAARIDDVVLEPPFNIVQTVDVGSDDGVAQLVLGVRRKIGAPTPFTALETVRVERVTPAMQPSTSFSQAETPRRTQSGSRFKDAVALAVILPLVLIFGPIVLALGRRRFSLVVWASHFADLRSPFFKPCIHRRSSCRPPISLQILFR